MDVPDVDTRLVGATVGEITVGVWTKFVGNNDERSEAIL